MFCVNLLLKERWIVTHKSGACGGVSGGRSSPEQGADNEEDHADKSLTRVDYDATAELIGGQGP